MTQFAVINNHNSVEAAIVFAALKHQGQKDKGGKPYILHPLRVMLAMMPDETAMKAAVLHDVIEDCGVTAFELRQLGFSDEVVEIVELLSRPGKDAPNRPTHREYVQAIIDSGNTRAIEVKFQDTRDNLNRVHELPPEEKGLGKRYAETIDKLWEALHPPEDSE